MNPTLTTEEEDFLESYENNEWVSIKETEQVIEYQSIAKNTFKKNRRNNADYNQ